MSAIIPSVSRNAFRRTAGRVAPATSAMPRFYSSTMHDNDPEVLEAEKLRNLSKQQHKTSTPIPEAPGWNEHLASASEAAVKADHHTASSPSEMAARTVQYIKDRHHADESPTFTEPPPLEPGVSTSRMRNGSSDPEGEAAYPRDEVDGPLKTAHGETIVEEVEEVVTRKRSI